MVWKSQIVGICFLELGGNQENGGNWKLNFVMAFDEDFSQDAYHNLDTGIISFVLETYIQVYKSSWRQKASSLPLLPAHLHFLLRQGGNDPRGVEPTPPEGALKTHVGTDLWRFLPLFTRQDVVIDIEFSKTKRTQGTNVRCITHSP